MTIRQTFARLELVSSMHIDGLEELEKSLKNVMHFVELRQKRSVVERVLNPKGDSVRDLQDSLKNALAVFQMQWSISIQRRLEEYTEARQANMEAVIAEIDAQADPVLQQTHPQSGPKATNSPRPLPPRPTALFGRMDELNELVDSCVAPTSESGPSRIAVLGSGGIGKSALVLAVLHDERVIASFGDQRFFVPCDSADSVSGLISLMASHIGLFGDRLRGRLVSALARSKALIVLDNFESTWEDSRGRSDAEDFLSVLAALPTLTLLVTMRGSERPQGLAWTTPLFKPLLPLDSAASQQLFLSILDTSPASSQLQELLDSLDGIPLAINLAAQMAQTVPLPELVALWRQERTALSNPATSIGFSRLDMSIKLSLNSPRVRESPDAQKLLSLLSVLAGGLPEVFQHPDFPQYGRTASVLKRAALAYVSDGRIRVLAPIRAYMLRHHPPPFHLIRPLERLCTTTAELCAGLGKHDTRHLLVQITPEIANVESLCAYIAQYAPDTEWLINVICRSDEFLVYAGLRTSSLLATARTIAATPRQQLQVLVRRVVRSPMLAEQEQLCNEIIDLARASGEKDYEAEGYLRLSIACHVAPRRLELAKQAVALYSQIPSDHVQHNYSWSLERMATAHLLLDQYAEAQSAVREAVRIAKASGLMRAESRASVTDADIYIRQGRLLKAAQVADRCLEMARFLDDTTYISLATSCRASAAAAMGDVDDAIRMHQTSIELCRRRGESDRTYIIETNLVHLLLIRGDFAEARKVLDDAQVRSQSSLHKLLGYSAASSVALHEGNLDDATALGLASVRLARERGAQRVEAAGYTNLGDIALAWPDPRVDDAMTAYIVALTMLGRIGNFLYLMPCIPRLGRVLHLSGDLDTARGVYEWGLDWSRRCGMKNDQARCLVGLAQLNDAVQSPQSHDTWKAALHVSRLASEKLLINECETRLRALTH
ncbi:hypothetical protein EXIGLDRAFT_774549 [Exidia glandulosa HHB12029]|uniref:MalT-like TPR region domain-containing protein n=1 Tax=Exidia glandulosa HHB12029 TaxID=1314781 RepID=A0A165EB64_EXIGL|nr:hypothetical protein EXIGLDRAFT_774549 [Exidia glandulosa HHB12029]